MKDLIKKIPNLTHELQKKICHTWLGGRTRDETFLSGKMAGTGNVPVFNYISHYKDVWGVEV
jgi:hypothetical protein